MERITRFVQAIRRYWKRLLVGAVVASLITRDLLISLLVWLEYNHIPYDFYDYARFAQVVVMFGIPAGALIAYSLRPKERTA